MPVAATVGFALAVALIGGLWRKRLPPGIGEAVFVAAISGAALLILAVDADGVIKATAVGRTLTFLTIIWYALSRVAARRSAPISEGDAETEQPPGAGPAVLIFASLICGLGSLVHCLTAPDGLGSQAGWSPAATDFLLLLAVSLAVWAFRTGDWAPYPALALVACLIVRTVAAEQVSGSSSVLAWLVPAWSVIALVATLTILIIDWRRRRRAWLDDNTSTPKSVPPGSDLFGPVAAISIVVGVVALGRAETLITALSLVMLAMTCLVIGHTRLWLWAGEAGLALLGLGVAVAVAAWTAPGWAGALLGITIAGGYLLWLARFWDQQLDNGRAWTTTGRLIPAARRLGAAASCAAVAAAAALLSTDKSSQFSIPAASITLALMLCVSRFYMRDTVRNNTYGAALSACCWLAAATAPTTRLLSAAFDMEISPTVGFAAGASVLALLVPLTPTSANAKPIFAAYLFGPTIMCALFTVAWRGLDSQAGATLILTLAAILAFSISVRPAKQMAESCEGT